MSNEQTIEALEARVKELESVIRHILAVDELAEGDYDGGGRPTNALTSALEAAETALLRPKREAEAKASVEMWRKVDAQWRQIEKEGREP